MHKSLVIISIVVTLSCFGCGKSMDERLRQASSAELQVDEELAPKLADAWSTSEIMELLDVNTGITVDELERRIGPTYDIFQFPDGTYGMGYYFPQDGGYKPITFIIDESGTEVVGMVRPLRDVLVALPDKPDEIIKQ